MFKVADRQRKWLTQCQITNCTKVLSISRKILSLSALGYSFVSNDISVHFGIVNFFLIMVITETESVVEISKTVDQMLKPSSEHFDPNY